MLPQSPWLIFDRSKQQRSNNGQLLGVTLDSSSCRWCKKVALKLLLQHPFDE